MPDTGESGEVPLVRPNFDTVYSSTVLDFTNGKVTITLPETDRYMSVFCIDQDQFTVHYDTAPAKFSLRKELLKTRDSINHESLLPSKLLESNQVYFTC